MEIKLFICPTPDCGNYYGSSSTPADLTQHLSGPKVENRASQQDTTGSPWTGARSDCPDCRERTGDRITRELVVIEVPLPEPRTPVPDLPPVQGQIRAAAIN